MFSMRAIVSLTAVLLASAVVNALPIPEVHPHHVNPGSVFVAAPAHFHPPLPGHSGASGHRNHPVVALSHPDQHGWVPVVSVSHHQPAHMQGAVHDAHHYDQHTAAAGHGSFSHGSGIAVGNPTHVHVTNLHHVSPDSNLPHQLHNTDAQNLRAEVHRATGFFANHPAHPPPSPHTPPWGRTHN